jgi:hypothetical protein
MMSNDRLVRVNALGNVLTDIDIPVSETGAELTEIDKYRGIAIGEVAGHGDRGRTCPASNARNNPR